MNEVAVLDPVVTKLDAARQALTEARTLQDVKRIADLAQAAKVYAQQQKLGEEAISEAHAIKVEALRRLGEMLKETPKNEGGRPNKTGHESTPVSTPTLADMGIDKSVSSIAQRLANLPAELFEHVRRRECSIDFAVRRKDRSDNLAANADRILREMPPPLGLRESYSGEDDPLIVPLQVSWSSVMQDLSQRGWSIARIGLALLATPSTVQRWKTSDDITYSYGSALLILHEFVCGKDLTSQRLLEATPRENTI